MKRRNFLGLGAISASSFFVTKHSFGRNSPSGTPIVISTWEPNKKANDAAWQVLANNGNALDAVHQGVMIPEADPEDQSVGYGGLPDRDGRVTLDACMMDHLGNCGAVMALEFIKHPSSVARLVMEKTPHVQIVGDGALQLALANGFTKENLLTENSRHAWEQWLKTSKYNPMTTIDNIREKIEKSHDTIGMLAIDHFSNISGACSTSGMAYKMHGRVGDSPIIGAGLFVDNEIGAASATGVGEEVVRIVGSHTVVEMMRQGRSPEESCKEAVRRMVKLKGEKAAKALQIGFIALNKAGEYGCFAMNNDFSMPIRTAAGPDLIKAKSWF